MPGRLQHDELVESLEREAGLEPGLLARLLALESSFPNLSARGQRRELLRTVSRIMDEAADRARAGEGAQAADGVDAG